MKVTVPGVLMKGAAQVTQVINDSNGSVDDEQVKEYIKWKNMKVTVPGVLMKGAAQVTQVIKCVIIIIRTSR